MSWLTLAFCGPGVFVTFPLFIIIIIIIIYTTNISHYRELDARKANIQTENLYTALFGPNAGESLW